MTESRKSVLIVTVEIDPADEEEFNRWYDTEHVPEKMEQPGFTSARRFKSSEDEPKYLCIYELDNPEAATAPSYMGKPQSDWSKSIMGRWKDWSRGVWVELTESAAQSRG